MSSPIAEQPMMRLLRVTLAGLLFLSLPPATSARGGVDWT
jgi:hypothetical protein